MALQTFSPREVQARVRGGESAELIAAETGWPLDKVLRYAEPLLAERVYISEQARAVEVRRSGGGATLLESAYAAIGSDPDAGTITWDAWRREDGRWIVSASYVDGAGSHSARWTYDHSGRNLHPLDDEARTLMGARPMPVPDPELDIAEALDLASEIPVVREESVEVRPHLVAVPDADDADDEAFDESLDAFDEGFDVEEEAAFALDVEPDQEPDIDTLFEEPAAPTHAAETVAIPHPSAPAPAAKPAARKTKTRKGRASVPSWDEILFGATKSDD